MLAPHAPPARASVLVMAALARRRAAAADPLAVKGGRLVDGRGRAVVLHGVNVVYKLAPYTPDFTRADARRLRGWGMNAIRLGVSWRALEPARGSIDTAYVARVRALVRRAGAEGLWVLVDMHQDLWSERFGGNGAPDWATLDDAQPFVATPFPFGYLQPAVGRSFTSFWSQPRRHPHEYVGAYGALAKVLAPETAVIGYDAFNEPACELTVAPCGVPPSPRRRPRYLRAVLPRAGPALHRADPSTPTFYEDWLTTDFGYPFAVHVADRQPGPELPRLLRPADPSRAVSRAGGPGAAPTARATRPTTTRPRW